MSRVQLALNVADLDESIDFYTKLFQTEPAKVRENYANFSIADPPLKLILFAAAGEPGTLNHIGVEVDSPPRSPPPSPGPPPTDSTRPSRTTSRAATPSRTRRGCTDPTTPGSSTPCSATLRRWAATPRVRPGAPPSRSKPG